MLLLSMNLCSASISSGQLLLLLIKESHVIMNSNQAFFIHFFTAAQEGISQNSQNNKNETWPLVQTNLPHDPQPWTDDKVDEELVDPEAQEVLGSWEDLLTVLEPHVQSITPAMPVPEVSAPAEVGSEPEAPETIGEAPPAIEEDVSAETFGVDADTNLKAPDEAIEEGPTAEAVVEEVTAVASQDSPEVAISSDRTDGSESAEVREIEEGAAVVCEIPSNLTVPVGAPTDFAAQVTASAVPQESPESAEGVGPLPYEAAAPGEDVALTSVASCETILPHFITSGIELIKS